MNIIVRDLDQSTGKHHDTWFQYHEIETEPIFQELINIENGLSCEIFFLTGNKNKVVELERAINSKNVKILTLDIDLNEIQHAEALDIVQNKCQLAFENINKLSQCQIDEKVAGEKIEDKPGDQNTVNKNGKKNNRIILVEDTSLNFQALNGLPGPYIKWFMKALGTSGLHKLLAGFENKSAEAVCTYALMADTKKIIFFQGIARGRITEPRGSSWGWDPVFEEERSRLTFGEMGDELKSKFSHRANALTVFKKYLTVLEDQIKK